MKLSSSEDIVIKEISHSLFYLYDIMYSPLDSSRVPSCSFQNLLLTANGVLDEILDICSNADKIREEHEKDEEALAKTITIKGITK